MAIVNNKVKFVSMSEQVLIHYGLNSQPDGLTTITVSKEGDVLSVAPNGDFDIRPAGSAGAWELCRVSGSIAVFNTDNGPIVFALAQGL